MQLSIPDGAQIHIVVSNGPQLALAAPEATAMPEQTVPQARRPILTGVLAVALSFASFEIGRFVSVSSASMPAARAATVVEQLPGTGAERAESRAPEDSIPDTFRRQLAQPPEVVPPPGQAPTTSGPAAASPFGLHD